MRPRPRVGRSKRARSNIAEVHCYCISQGISYYKRATEKKIIDRDVTSVSVSAFLLISQKLSANIKHSIVLCAGFQVFLSHVVVWWVCGME